MLKSFKSKFNGSLEVSFRDGRKVLDSENANYSYGSAQSVWNKVFKKIPLNEVKSALVFGLGGGSVLDVLRNDFNYHGKITAVEIDPVVIALAKNEFEVVESKSLKIVCMDAFDYVSKRRGKFDLIVVDISIDYTIPEKILTAHFWENLVGRMNVGGTIVFNALNYTDKISHIKEILITAGAQYKVIKKVNGTNTIVFAKF